MSNRTRRACNCAKWLLGVAAVCLLTAASVPAAPKPSEPKPSESAVASSGVITAQSIFALRLVGALAAKQPGANAVVSPASVAGALAVIEQGGDAKFQANLSELLAAKKAPPAWTYFDALRRATSHSADEGPLATANAIYFDLASKPYAPAIESLAQAGIETKNADFGSPDTLAAINAWVNEKTKGKIPTIVEELPKETGLVALNALYFKDRWQQPFDAKETSNAPFHLVGGATAEIPLMHAGDRQFSFRQDARFVAVDLPYATKGFSLVVVTTRDAPAAAAGFSGVSEWLEGKGFADTPGEVALPRFGVSASIDLMPALLAMGLKPPAALPGFAPGPLRLAKVQQRVELKVDEEGTEAAAATAITATRSLEGNYVKMVVDKPFVFALRDAKSGLIIMAGYVGKPETADVTASTKPASN